MSHENNGNNKTLLDLIGHGVKKTREIRKNIWNINVIVVYLYNNQNKDKMRKEEKIKLLKELLAEAERQNEYEPKKGDFVVIEDGCILQLREDFTGGGVRIDGFGDFKVDKIREATSAEREAKIKEFKSRGWICGEDGIWIEPKLEEVYCVAKSRADLANIYIVKPEIVRGDFCLGGSFVCCDERGHIFNVPQQDLDKTEVSIEKFIELIKKQ